MNDAPVKLITISGVFNAPDNRPVPGITLKLRTRKYTNRLFQNEEISCVTGRGGEYSLSVLPGDYEVSCAFKPTERAEVLGVVHIQPDSPDGTLNDFLGLTAGENYPPSIVVKIIEWVDLAEYYADQAKQAAADAGINPRGAFDPAAMYAVNDLVQLAGSEYCATAEVTGISPPAAPWELFVSVGQVGPANVLTVGTVETLPAGSQATVTITGDSPNQVINLGIPAGDSGSASSVPDFGGPGDCGFFMHMNNSVTYEPGDNVPGSELNYCCANDKPTATGNPYQGSGTYPAGTWRAGGLIQSSGIASHSVLVCTRIDGTQLAAPHIMLSASNNGAAIKNCRYSAADGNAIDCDVEINGKWLPFTASFNDSTSYGPIIYENAVAGEYGDVQPYDKRTTL